MTIIMMLNGKINFTFMEILKFMDSGTKEEFFSHSIRPKFKYKFLDENIVSDYRFYYKPRVDDLKIIFLSMSLKISIATFYEALSIDLNYTNKYNSRYDGVKL